MVNRFSRQLGQVSNPFHDQPQAETPEQIEARKRQEREKAMQSVYGLASNQALGGIVSPGGYKAPAPSGAATRAQGTPTPPLAVARPTAPAMPLPGGVTPTATAAAPTFRPLPDLTGAARTTGDTPPTPGGGGQRTPGVTTPPPTPTVPTTPPAPGAPPSREEFDVDGYLKANPDVAAAIQSGAFGRDPYQHFLEYGQREGRTGWQRTGAGATTPGATTPTPEATPIDPNWKTNGFPPPGHVVTPTGPALPGWDQTKWADPMHQSPKYVVGRILNQFPHTVEGLAQALPEIQKAYPGAKLVGRDKIEFAGLTIDVLQGSAQGGTGWQWIDLAEQQGLEQTMASNPSAAAMGSVFQGVGGLNTSQMDVQALIVDILAQLGIGGNGGR